MMSRVTAARHSRLLHAALVAAGAALALLVSSSGAETVRGTAGADRLIGTADGDVLLGLGARDYLESRRGDDFLNGGAATDALFAGAGADRIEAAFDGSADRIACGLGRDVVAAERADKVGRDCELVSRQLSRDPFRGLRAQEGTEVEPDSYANGAVVVSAFQVGRFRDGGALATGYSTSRDGGRTWRSGLLPFLTRVAKPAGHAEFAADPSVAYDVAHRLWLIASLAALPAADAILVSRSRDGLRWRGPLSAARSTAALDKSWIACDNWRRSPYFGRCYVAYREGTPGRIVVKSTNDGGRAWSAGSTVAVGETRRQSVNGALPLVRPDGSLVVAFTVEAVTPRGPDEIAVARSTDGGAAFGPQERVAVLPRSGLSFLGLRAPQFVSGDVDADGTVYLAWQGCVATPCEDGEISLTQSVGESWSAPAAVPIAAAGSRLQVFLPALAVAPGSRGARARITIFYYTMDCGRLACPIDAALIASADGGRTWSAPRRLSAESMPLAFLADTSQGRMLGDYVSVSYSRGRAVAVFALATAPARTHLNEAIFAVRAPRERAPSPSSPRR
jgi:RTX calcium-binding nonapeptide repeat (4 copies)